MPSRRAPVTSSPEGSRPFAIAEPTGELPREDARFPARLRRAARPERLVHAGPFDPDRRAVAIVGARSPVPAAAFFAAELARRAARLGLVVVSGGAHGVDSAAHLGAARAGAPTWVVCPNGPDAVVPAANAWLQREVLAQGGALVWPLPAGTRHANANYHLRNGVIAALAEALVVVQAERRSGARSAAAKARTLGVPVWAVPGVPGDPAFEGCQLELDAGARPLVRLEDFFAALGLREGQQALGLPPLPARPARAWSAAESALLKCLAAAPRHIDEILNESGVYAGPGRAALLTLALEAVVVEGPAGWFRRLG